MYESLNFFFRKENVQGDLEENSAAMAGDMPWEGPGGVGQRMLNVMAALINHRIEKKER